jgi:hypothetical protein
MVRGILEEISTMANGIEETPGDEAQDFLEAEVRAALLRLLDILASRIAVELARGGEANCMGARHS